MADGQRKVSGLVYVLVILVLVGLGATGYMYKKYQDTQKQVERLSNPQEAQKLETQKTIDAVGKLIQLPSGETPTIATVQDRDKLKDQTFFAKSENGDKVLIYPQAKKAILYRPSADKVIEVGQLNINQDTKATPDTPATSPKK